MFNHGYETLEDVYGAACSQANWIGGGIALAASILATWAISPFLPLMLSPLGFSPLPLILFALLMGCVAALAMVTAWLHGEVLGALVRRHTRRYVGGLQEVAGPGRLSAIALRDFALTLFCWTAWAVILGNGGIFLGAALLIGCWLVLYLSRMLAVPFPNLRTSASLAYKDI